MRINADSLLRRFITEELSIYSKAILLDAIDQSNSSEVVRKVNFNVFDILIDYETGTVTLADVLEANSEQKVNIAEFRKSIAEVNFERSSS